MSFRIGTIVERSGVPGMTLRSWERRYGFPRPKRSRSGYRVYSEDDLSNVIAVKRLIDDGSAASEAIALVRSGKAPVPEAPAILLDAYVRAAKALDQAELELLAQHAETTLGIPQLLRDFVLVGLRRAADELDIAGEHMATGILRSLLRKALQRLPAPKGRPIVLACPEREEHEGGLLVIAVQLRLLGAATAMLGANTPSEALADAARRLNARAIGISLVQPRPDQDIFAMLAATVKRAKKIPVVVGGAFARKKLELVYKAGALFAESAEELLELVS